MIIIVYGQEFNRTDFGQFFLRLEGINLQVVIDFNNRIIDQVDQVSSH